MVVCTNQSTFNTSFWDKKYLGVRYFKKKLLEAMLFTYQRSYHPWEYAWTWLDMIIDYMTHLIIKIYMKIKLYQSFLPTFIFLFLHLIILTENINQSTFLYLSINFTCNYSVFVNVHLSVWCIELHRIIIVSLNIDLSIYLPICISI